MKNDSNGTLWPRIIGGIVLVIAALGAATFVAATDNPDSAAWVSKTQNYLVSYLVSIANHEQAGAAWLHPEFESVQAYEASLIKPALVESFSEGGDPTSAAKSVESATSKTLSSPLSTGYFTHSFHQQQKDAVAQDLPPQH